MSQPIGRPNLQPTHANTLVFHHRALYKHIHKRHHEWKKPMAVNTEYAHPVEHLVRVCVRAYVLRAPVHSTFDTEEMNERPIIATIEALTPPNPPALKQKQQVGNVFTTFGGPLLLGSHVLVFWAFLFFRLWETFDAHSGYTLPGLSPFSAIPWWTGPQM